MKLLLDDRFAPITSEFGFIEKDAAAVAEWFREWDESNVRGRGVVNEKRSVTGSLEQLLQMLEPLTTVERRRHLFVSTRGAWTAYFDNGCDGGDAARLAFFALELKVRAIRLVAVPDTRRGVATVGGRFGGTIFELYGPEEIPGGFLNSQRSVSVANDGGRWRFDQHGPLLAFEDPAIFKARTIRDRFSFEHLARYLGQLGIDAFDASFYERTGVLVERRGPHVPDMRECSLEAVRASWEHVGGHT